MKQASSALAHIKVLGAHLKDNQAKRKKQEMDINMLKSKLGSAQRSLATKVHAVEKLEVKNLRVEKAETNLETSVSITDAKLVKTEDALMKQQFQVNKAKLKLEDIVEAGRRIKDKVMEEKQEEKSFKAVSSRLGQEIASQQKELVGIVATYNKDKKITKAQGKLVKSRVSEMTKLYKDVDTLKGRQAATVDLKTATIKNGLKQEEYYFTQKSDVPNFDALAPAATRIVPLVNYASTRTNWPHILLTDNFAVRWSGAVVITQPGDYTFSITSDDGSKLYIDGESVVNDGGTHSMQEEIGSVELAEGQHDLRLEFF